MTVAVYAVIAKTLRNEQLDLSHENQNRNPPGSHSLSAGLTRCCARAIDNPSAPSSAIDRWPGKDGNPAYEPLVPTGETVSQGGLYDPSIEYSADEKTGWLVYSAVLRGPKYAKQVPIGPYCETHLARSTDGGKTWTFVQAINRSQDDKLQNFDGQKLPGVWRYEVPSIVSCPRRRWAASGALSLTTIFGTCKRTACRPMAGSRCRPRPIPAGKWSEPIALFGFREISPEALRLDIRQCERARCEPEGHARLYRSPGHFTVMERSTLRLRLW